MVYEEPLLLLELDYKADRTDIGPCLKFKWTKTF